MSLTEALLIIPAVPRFRSLQLSLSLSLSPVSSPSPSRSSAREVVAEEAFDLSPYNFLGGRRKPERHVIHDQHLKSCHLPFISPPLFSSCLFSSSLLYLCCVFLLGSDHFTSRSGQSEEIWRCWVVQVPRQVWSVFVLPSERKVRENERSRSYLLRSQCLHRRLSPGNTYRWAFHTENVKFRRSWISAFLL